MAKIKLHQLHKVKIHRNRWLIWSIAYAVVVAIAVIGYIKVSDVGFQAQVPAANTFVPSHTYNDQRLGFGLRYPANWSIEAGSSTAITFTPTDSAEEGVTIRVLDPGDEADLRDSLQIISESVVTVDGQKGKELVNDLGNRARETLILVDHAGKLYVISGSNDLVEQALVTFRFLN
jgi:hypothetical protein